MSFDWTEVPESQRQHVAELYRPPGVDEAGFWRAAYARERERAAKAERLLRDEHRSDREALRDARFRLGELKPRLERACLRAAELETLCHRYEELRPLVEHCTQIGGESVLTEQDLQEMGL